MRTLFPVIQHRLINNFCTAYERYRRGAPLKRNEKIVELADVIIALWDGKSRGTKFTIDYAKKLKKEVKIYVIGN